MISPASALRLVPMLLACLLAACERHAEANAPNSPRPVLTAPVEVRASKSFGPFTGTIQPRYTSDLGFQIAGRIVVRDVSLGDVVKKGQRLAALDPAVIKFQLASAKADLVSAQAQFVKAQAEERRQQLLLRTGASPQSQIDSAVSALAAAQGRLSQAKASLDAQEIQLGYTDLRADYDGVVTAVNAQVGQVVSAGQTIITEARPDVREAVFDVPDFMANDAREADKFAITLLADPTVKSTGAIREIAPLSDPATRTRRIRLSLADPPAAFRLGSTVRVAWSEPIEPQAVVPASALVDDKGADAVWVAAAGTVKKVGVKIVERLDDRVAVDAVLFAGERVVVAGVRSLHDGQPVREE